MASDARTHDLSHPVFFSSNPFGHLRNTYGLKSLA